MLLNEPPPHQTRPAATAAATANTRELPPVELDGAPTPPRRSIAEADTVAFTAVDAGAVGQSAGAGNGATTSANDGAASTNGAGTSASNGAATSNGASANSGARSGDSAEASASDGPDVDSTAEPSAEPDRDGDGDVDATSESEPRFFAEAPTVGIEPVVLRPDATETVALDVEAVKRAVAEGLAASDATATVSLDVAAVKRAMAEESADTEPADIKPTDTEPTDNEPTDTGPVDDSPVESDPPASTSTSTSTDLVPTAESTVDTPTEPYLVSTDLSTSASTLVAVPETADDVIATIHAAATAVAAADRRARQAAVAKADPWTGLDLRQPPVPAPVDNVLDLLAPVLERPLLVVEQPGLPAAADVVALHRSELEADFVEPPVVAAGAEPPIPPRYGPGLSVLPHIEFPV